MVSPPYMYINMSTLTHMFLERETQRDGVSVICDLGFRVQMALKCVWYAICSRYSEEGAQKNGVWVWGVRLSVPNVCALR